MKSIKIARIIAITSSAFIALCAILVIGVKLLEPQIEKKVLNNLETILPYGFEVRNFHATIFDDFPSISASFSDMVIYSPDSTEFIRSEDFSLRLDTWQLIKGNIIIDGVMLRNGDINIMVDDKNNGNWNIFDNNPKDSTEQQLSIQIAAAEVSHMTVHYHDYYHDQFYDIEIAKGNIKGKILDNIIDLDVNLTTHVGKFNVDKMTMLRNKVIDIAGNIMIDLDERYYQFRDIELSSGEAIVATNGSVKVNDKNTYITFDFDSGTMPLVQAIGLLPESEQKTFSQYDLGGHTQIRGKVAGVVNETKGPEISLSVRLNNASIKSSSFPQKIQNLNTHIQYIQSAYGKGDLIIDKITGNYGADAFTGGIDIKDIEKPLINMEFSGTLPLAILLTKERSPSIYTTEGSILTTGFYIKNYKPYAPDNKYAEMGGKFEVKDVELLFNNQTAQVSQAITELTRDDVFIIDKLEFAHKNTSIKLKGSIKNLILGIFRSEKQEKINFDLAMDGEQVDLAEISQFLSYSTEINSKTATSETAFYEPLKGLRGSLRTDISSLSYNKIKGKDFIGKLFFNLDEVDINGSLRTCDGLMKLNGNLDYSSAPKFDGAAEVIDINVHDLFFQWDNFTQEVVTSDNLYGTINAAATLQMEWDNHGNYLTDELDAKVSVLISEGRLKNFELLETFSSYVDINDLRDIKFSELSNIILIRDKNLYLPAMFIQNNAMNLVVNGIHTFDQKIDYNIKVNAGQILAQKFHKKQNATLIPAKKHGWFNLYYTVTGDLNVDFNYQQDRNKVRSSFWQSIDLRDRIYNQLSRTFSELPAINEPIEWDDDNETSLLLSPLGF